MELLNTENYGGLNTNKFRAILVVAFLFSISCRGPSEQEIHISLSESYLNNVDSPKISVNHSTIQLLYYFDGQCGLCFVKLKGLMTLMSTRFSRIPCVFVTTHELTSESRRMMDFLKISQPILQDSVNVTLISTEKLELNQVYFLNINGQVIIKGDPSQDYRVRRVLDKYYHKYFL